MGNLLELFRKNDIGEPPWEYDFLVNLPESEYPKYLAKIFNYRTGEKLPLKFDFKQQAWVIDKKRCKTFNQKIQWIKLYGVTDLMRKCTDKVAVRDYVKEKIGEEYLKPVLQIIPDNKETDCALICPPCGESTCDSRGKGVQNDVSTYFDQINWEKLPNSFVIKCNHGSKWQYIIKDKEDVLNTKPVVDIMRKNITGWLEQEYFPWNGFEMQYKGIKPKILIEPLMRNELNKLSIQIQFYCFNGVPKIIQKLYNNENQETCLFDENLNCINEVFSEGDNCILEEADNLINYSLLLSKKLSENFKFVRVDWTIYQNKIYFEELTFTPFSGFHKYIRQEIKLKLRNCFNFNKQSKWRKL